MDMLQSLASQLQLSLTTSQIIISVGLLALGAIWGRMKAGMFLSLGTVAFWGYSANEAILWQMAGANTYVIFMSLFIAMMMGFLLIYAWVSTSSR